MSDSSKTYRKFDQSLSGLYVFEQVAQHKSITKAAAAMGITQSAVSQKIRDLEARFGTTLFTRLHRGVSLTDDGKKLRASTAPAITQLLSAIETFAQRRAKPRVRLAMDFAFASFWFLPRLPHLRATLGDEIDIQVLTSQSPASISKQEHDILIDMRVAKPGDIRLFGEQIIAVASPAYLRAHGPIAAPEALQNAALLGLTAPQGAHWHNWPSWLGTATAPASIDFNSYDLVIQAALAGQGIALGWLGLIDDKMTSGALVQVTNRRVSSDISYVLSRPSPSSHSGLGLVYDWIAQQSGA
ncbi:MAG: LysR family transcriptional regulator [Rhodobacteraceae bacterium]|nr:LysR family transcriptional regulator [Paracoccaceae bacterium]